MASEGDRLLQDNQKIYKTEASVKGKLFLSSSAILLGAVVIYSLALHLAGTADEGVHPCTPGEQPSSFVLHYEEECKKWRRQNGF